VTEPDRGALGARLVERAYLEGDFVLRSGRRSRYYLDKYRFETDPELLDGLGRLLAARVAEQAPEVELLAGPELGAVPLVALASVHSGLPFVIVRKEAKGYGTENRLEGVYEAGGRVCVVEDVVTSGGALVSAVEALRAAGLVVSAAICVVDRQEGGAAAVAAADVRFGSLWTVAELGVAGTPNAA
jgi:orotate phosphoribosyltransferase